MAGQTAWLKGQMHWVGGRVGWENGPSLLVPRVGDIALAQRRLGQIARLSRRAPAPGQLWLTDRHTRLQLAKQLQSLYEPDLATLISSRQTDPQRWQRLAALLPVEMLCSEPLPYSPAQALLTGGWAALPALHAQADNTEQPIEGRVLSAWLIGAIQATDPACDQQFLAWPDSWSQRAYQWGRQAEMIAYLRLIGLLLAEPDGLELARRCQAALAVKARCQLSVETLRKFLLEGTPANEVVAIAEAAVTISPMFRNSYSLRFDTRLRRSLSNPLPYQYDLYLYSNQLQDELKTLLHKYVCNVRQSAVLDYFGRGLQFLLGLAGYEVRPIKQIGQPLAEGLKLPPHLQLPYLQILVEEHAILWEERTFFAERHKNFLGWLDRYNSQANYVQNLLRTTGDPAIVRQIIQQKALGQLHCAYWSDIEYYRLFLRLNQHFNFHYISEDADNLVGLLPRFPTPKAAQAAFDPLVAATESIDRKQYWYFIPIILEHSPIKHLEVREWLAVQSRYVSKLAEFIKGVPGDERVVAILLNLIFEIDQKFGPQQAENWIDLILKTITERIKDKSKSVCYYNAHLNLRLAWLVDLVGDDLKTLLSGLETIATIDYDMSDKVNFEAGRQLLKKFPILQKALGLTLPLHHDRCIRLVEGLGQAARLGETILTPLEILHFQEDLPPDPQWQVLLGFAPTEGYRVKQYRLARRLTGQSEELPGGLHKILQVPTRLATELAHLEARLTVQADQPHLAARVTSLRERLADQTRMEETIKAEIAKKLPLAWATALLEAAEQRMRECYRKRLNSLVREFPPTAPMSDDLLNAVMMTTDIRYNQRWLLKLLRSWLRGNTGWRENLPDNQTFLKQLTHQWHGRAEVWLAENPKTYDLPQAGGPVELRLETNPLHVLQMGNYFDTCLSLGSFNAFSTVTNAIELNKRVIYATNTQGKVIGRKLIAITTEGKLVGYHNYTNLSNELDNFALRRVLEDYCRELAGLVGLELAEDGTVAWLLTHDWYDDGTEEWSKVAVEKPVDKVVDKSRPKSIDKKH